MTELSRLKWQCRRGMRELDVLLGRYLETQFPASGEREKTAFRQLLTLSDPELSGYLLGGDVPDDPEVANVVTRIRGKP